MRKSPFLVTILSLMALAAFATLHSRCTQPPHPAQAAIAPLTPHDVDTNRTRIVIRKSAYTLTLYEGNDSLRTYPVVLGFNPTDDKHREGDGCTPEGTFHLRDKYPHNKWSRFLWIDYPTAESWTRFNNRKAQNLIPQDATIGGEIGIHGVPSDRDDLIANCTNWTLGCISLTTADILELYPLVKVGTEVKILH